MFENIGGKLKTTASVLAWFGIIGSCVYGLFLTQRSIVAGIITAVVGSLSAWIGSFTMYGIGEAVENSERILYRLNNIDGKLKNIENGTTLLTGSSAAKPADTGSFNLSDYV